MNKEAKPRKKIAIVTGASSGLGAEFALQLEKKYFLDEIWLVARRATPMRELAEKFLKSTGVVITADLSSRSDLAALQKRLAEEKPEIEFLVNNAGFGKVGPFDRLGLAEQVQMIDLNVTGLTWLTHAAIPFMNPGSAIIQVASSAGFTPAPFFSVYAATKAFVVSFSDALGYELRGQGIRVIAVCPGPVETEFFEVSQKSEFMKDRVGEAEPFNRKLAATSRDVVAKALADLQKGRRHSIYGTAIQLFSLLAPYAPTALKLKLLASRNPQK